MVPKAEVKFLLLVAIFIALGLTACSEKQNVSKTTTENDPDQAEVVKSTLFSIITLQGSPCEKVISYEEQSNLDYVASCENGVHYRIHVSPEGRININPHTSK